MRPVKAEPTFALPLSTPATPLPCSTSAPSPSVSVGVPSMLAVALAIPITVLVASCWNVKSPLSAPLESVASRWPVPRASAPV